MGETALFEAAARHDPSLDPGLSVISSSSMSVPAVNNLASFRTLRFRFLVIVFGSLHCLSMCPALDATDDLARFLYCVCLEDTVGNRGVWLKVGW